MDWMVLVCVVVFGLALLACVAAAVIVLHGMSVALRTSTETLSDLTSQFAFQVMTPKEQQLDLAERLRAEEVPDYGVVAQRAIEQVRAEQVTRPVIPDYGDLG